MAARALDLPLGLFGILFIGGFVALSLGLALALRPFVQRRFGDEHNAVFDTGFSAVGTMYAIVAGLLVLGGAALNPIYWVILFVGAFLTILHLALLRMENLAMHLIAVGVTAAMLGLVLCLLIQVNLPFRGEISLSPDDFRTAMATMATIGR